MYKLYKDLITCLRLDQAATENIRHALDQLNGRMLDFDKLMAAKKKSLSALNQIERQLIDKSDVIMAARDAVQSMIHVVNNYKEVKK